MAYTYPAANPGSVYHVIINYTMMQQQLQSNFHWRLEGNTNSRTIDVVCNALGSYVKDGAGSIVTLIRGLLEPDQTVTTLTVQQIQPNRFVGVGFNVNLTGLLPQVESLNITQMAAVLTRRSVEGTRRGVSSLHIPLAVQTQTIGDGVLTAAAQAKVGDIGNAILNAKNMGDGITMVPVIYHRNFVPATSVIESFKVQPTLRVVRRRTVGLGI